MRKTLPISTLLAGLALFLAGCASRPPEVLKGTPAGTRSATQAPIPSPSSTAEAATGHCTASSLSATPDPTTASLFPQPGASDWSNGPAGAPVTFIEYGDFM